MNAKSLVSQNHLLRKIDAAVNWEQLYEMSEPRYSENNAYYWFPGYTLQERGFPFRVEDKAVMLVFVNVNFNANYDDTSDGVF